MFRVGDEVVCVDASPCAATGRVSGLAHGGRYTVAALCGGTGGLGVLLIEAVAPATVLWGPDYGFRASRFRKVQKRNDRLTIEAFSVIKDGGFEEPKRRAPAKKRERA